MLNFSVRDSQFLSVISRIVGFAHAIFAAIFGMASVNVDRRQLEVGYLVLASQLKDEHDLAYALDLFDLIDYCRKQRDIVFGHGRVAEFRGYEARRNEYITELSNLLESRRSVAR